MFNVEFVTKHSELDVWCDGCQPDTYNMEWVSIEFEADTLDELFKYIRCYFNISKDDLILNSCDEKGRLDIQTYTKTPVGNINSFHTHKEAFKNGDINMWLHCFTGTVIETTVCDLTL